MFEHSYAQLVSRVLQHGELRHTRNGNTLSTFNAQVVIDDLQFHQFPILRGRQMFYKGVLGELAAMLRRHTCNGDFMEQGCRYWSKFADDDGSLRVDYGNAWFNFNGVNQIAELKRMLREDPTNRRMIISGWNPANLNKLSLPCCHLLYQFYVTNTNELHMKWYQRSVDVMIGLPSDAIFAAAWLLAICREFGFRPGSIVMDFCDVHIYEEHFEGAQQYIGQWHEVGQYLPPAAYVYTAPAGTDFCTFTQQDIEVINYKSCPIINFELKV